MEGFRAYAIASTIGLAPEMDTAPLLTPSLDQPGGDELRLRRALSPLARFREPMPIHLISCFTMFLDIDSSGWLPREKKNRAANGLLD